MSGLRRSVERLLVLLAFGLPALSTLGFASIAGATTFSRVATLTHEASALVTGASADGQQVLIVADPASLLFSVPPENKRPLFLASPSATPRTIDRGFDQGSAVSSNGRYIAWVNHNCSDRHSAYAFVQSTQAGASARELVIPKPYSHNDISSIVVSPDGRVTVLSLADDHSTAACTNLTEHNAILSAAPGSRRFEIVARAAAPGPGDSAVSSDGSTFALCGSTVSAVRATARLRVARGLARVGVGPAVGCAASDRGTATVAGDTPTGSTLFVTVGLGRTHRVDVRRPELNGQAFAINPTGTRAVIAADSAGRLVVVDLLDGRARTLPRPGFLAHAPGALFGITAPLTWLNAHTVAGVVSRGARDDGFVVDPKTGGWSPPLREPTGQLIDCGNRSGRVLWTDSPDVSLPDRRFYLTAPDSLRFRVIDNRLGTISNLSCPAGQGRVFLTMGPATGTGPVNVDATPLGAIDGSSWNVGP